MIEWWNSLPTELKVFYGIGAISLLVVVFQLLLTLFGFDADSVDGGINIDSGGIDFDSGTGIGLFSTQTIAAFFVAFGWIGVAVTKSGLDLKWVGIIAFLSGIVSMALMYYMLRGLLRLQSNGNLKYDSAVGKEGTVYVTIPGDDNDGGQIQIVIQGRLTTASARKSGPGSIPPGERIRVVGLSGPTSFRVEEILSKSPS